jgi:radical SAM superfamily enzyme YgiQ (UPF0313 family)
MVKGRVLLVGIYDTNTVALAPEILRAYAQQFPIARQFDIRTVNFSIFSQNLEEMERRIRDEDAEIVGFSTYIWNVNLVRELAARIPGKIILGGPMVNEIDDDFFETNPEVDIVVSGEGEDTFTELLESFAGQRPLEEIGGIRTSTFQSPPRGVIENLESVPSPYERIFKDQPDLEWIAYETSRGCPFLCGFCTWGYSKKMRYHSLERVFSDLDVILAQPSLDRIYLCDSSILLDKPRAKAILRHIIDKSRDVVIRYEFNAEHLDDEIIDLLLQLPENEFNFGVQTISPAALQTMRRPFHQNKFEANYHKMVRRTERTHITMDVIYGLPGDDLDEYKASLNYTLGFDHVNWILTNPLILLPGSDFYRDQELHGIRIRDKESYIVESTASFPPEDMAEAIKISFWVSTVYFNARFRNAMRSFARSRGQRYVDTISEFFEALPFPLIGDADYPLLVPSVAKDFRKRNLAIWRVANIYASIVECFNAYTDGAYADLMADYEDHFGPQFIRLKRFATEEAARAGVPAPELPPDTQPCRKPGDVVAREAS